VEIFFVNVQETSRRPRCAENILNTASSALSLSEKDFSSFFSKIHNYTRWRLSADQLEAIELTAGAYTSLAVWWFNIME